MVLGYQTVLRKPVYALSFLTPQAVTVVHLEVNNVCNFHCSVQACPINKICTPVEQLHPFERDHIVGLWEAGCMYRQSAAHVSMVCRCF